jgi:hypothetical protein
MPTINQMQIPVTQSASEFEDIVRSSFKVRWDSRNLQRHGRNGQSQFGVDISGQDDMGREVGIQCRKVDKMTIKIIEGLALASESFDKPPLDAFYVAVGTPRDGVLFRRVRALTEERKAKGKYPIGIFFWEDIIEELVTSPTEFAKHYPELAPQRYSVIPDNFFALRQKMDQHALEGYQAIHLLSIELTEGLRVSRDMDYGDVIDWVAWDLADREADLTKLMKSYSLYFDEEINAHLQAAAGACAQGRCGIKKTKYGPELTEVAFDGAKKLLDHMEEVVKLVRARISRIGHSGFGSATH